MAPRHSMLAIVVYITSILPSDPPLSLMVCDPSLATYNAHYHDHWNTHSHACGSSSCSWISFWYNLGFTVEWVVGRHYYLRRRGVVSPNDGVVEVSINPGIDRSLRLWFSCTLSIKPFSADCWSSVYLSSRESCNTKSFIWFCIITLLAWSSLPCWSFNFYFLWASLKKSQKLVMVWSTSARRLHLRTSLLM